MDPKPGEWYKLLDAPNSLLGTGTVLYACILDIDSQTLHYRLYSDRGYEIQEAWEYNLGDFLDPDNVEDRFELITKPPFPMPSGLPKAPPPVSTSDTKQYLLNAPFDEETENRLDDERMRERLFGKEE